MNNFSKPMMDDNELAFLLKKTQKPTFDEGFSNVVMRKVYQFENQKTPINNYFRRSWILLGISVALALSIFVFQNDFQYSVQVLLNALIPGLFDAFIYILLIAITGLLFFELNLLTNRFYQEKRVKVQG